jgi:hypothetical protein
MVKALRRAGQEFPVDASISTLLFTIPDNREVKA